MDLAHVGTMMKQFIHDPNYLSDVDRVLQYLKVILERKLMFNIGGKLIIETYNDVDYSDSVK